MGEHRELPAGLDHVRTTDVFDEHNHPAGLLRAHRIAKGVWGRLTVHTGALQFAFDDTDDTDDTGEAEDGTVPAARTVTAGATVAIPPTRPHHLVLDGPVTFSLEFYREPEGDSAGTGQESSGLPS